MIKTLSLFRGNCAVQVKTFSQSDSKNNFAVFHFKVDFYPVNQIYRLLKIDSLSPTSDFVIQELEMKT